MPNLPPSLPDSRTGSRNGLNHDSRNGSRSPSGSGAPGFLAPFLGAFAAVFVLAILGAIVYFGYGAIRSMSSSSSSTATTSGEPGNKKPLQNVAGWQLGSEPSKQLDANSTVDIGWWNRTFNLPNNDQVLGYLKKQGLDVSKIVPAHYADSKDSTVITYQVYAQVPTQLLRLQQIPWHPNNPDLARFAPMLVLNDGLPAGRMWDTQNPVVAAQAGTKLDFDWQVTLDKNHDAVTTSRLPFSENVYTQQQVAQYQAETANTITALSTRIQEINAQVQNDLQAQLAQIPSDPPQPQLLSRKWGGDGSGEPTRSAERIGGGAAAGAAGGAMFGAAAGDAGMGAGIGAGVGLLGGLIYDGVSKSNDKKKYQAKVDNENAERMSAWKAEKKSLANKREQAKKAAAAERDRELNALADQIAANQGHFNPSATTTSAPAQTAPVNAPDLQPTATQPSGPIRQP